MHTRECVWCVCVWCAYMCVCMCVCVQKTDSEFDQKLTTLSDASDVIIGVFQLG